MELIDQ